MATLGCPVFSDIRDLLQLMFGSSIAIEVVPQQLFNTADRLKTKVSSAQYQISDMINLMNSMRRYWEGKVSDSRKKDFDRKLNQMEEILKMIDAYAIKLQTIAENYIETEDKNENSASALPINIIS